MAEPWESDSIDLPIVGSDNLPPPGFVLEQSGPPEGFVLEEPGKRPVTRAEQVLRGLGLGVRYLTETPALTVAGAADVLAKGINTSMGALGATYQLPENRAQVIHEGFSRMGFPEPAGTAERVVEGISRAGAGAMIGPAVGSQLARMTSSQPSVAGGIARVLTDSLKTQATSAATGAGAGAIAAESGAGPFGQFVATMAGGAAPAAAQIGGQMAIRGLVRGNDPAAMRQTIGEFQRAGTSPSVAQATQGRGARATEALLSRAPGAAGRMARTSEQLADDIAANIERRATELAGKVSAERAGRAILSINDDFVPRFRGVQGRLYDELDPFMPARIPLAKTAKVLNQIAGPIKGAERTSEIINNPTLRRIAAALADDMGPDEVLPYAAAKRVRSIVGERLSNPSLIDAVNRRDRYLGNAVPVRVRIRIHQICAASQYRNDFPIGAKAISQARL